MKQSQSQLPAKTFRIDSYHRMIGLFLKAIVWLFWIGPWTLIVIIWEGNIDPWKVLFDDITTNEWKKQYFSTYLSFPFPLSRSAVHCHMYSI